MRLLMGPEEGAASLATPGENLRTNTHKEEVKLRLHERWEMKGDSLLRNFQGSYRKAKDRSGFK